MPAASVDLQHDLFRHGLSNGLEGGLGDGDTDHASELNVQRRRAVGLKTPGWPAPWRVLDLDGREVPSAKGESAAVSF